MVEKLIDALVDPKVIDAFGQALGGTISRIVDQYLDKKLGVLVNRVTKLEEKEDKWATDRKKVEEENVELRRRIDEMEAYSRGDNLIFHGLPSTSYAEAGSASSNVTLAAPPGMSTRTSITRSGATDLPIETHRDTEQVVIDLVNKYLDVPITREDISVAHRLPKRPTDTKPAAIIVRFTNRRARNAVFYGRKALKTRKPGVYINEHLIQSRAMLLSEARKLVKSNKLQGAWTNNGSIYIRLSGSLNSKPIRVESINDLPRG